MQQKTKYLIVGQGLAGSILAYFLEKKGCDYFIIDETSGATASRQATGLINPVTGRRLVKSWMIETLLPKAKETYLNIQNEFNKNLVEETSILKLITSVEQLNDVSAKLEDEDYKSYLSEIQKVDQNLFFNDLGAFEILNILQININNLLDVLLHFFQGNNKIKQEKFDYKELSKEGDLWKYKNIAAENIIFCEGFNTRQNPYFNYLPLRQTKGEALIFESNELPEDKVIGGICSITPLGNHQFYAGATYDWDDIDLVPTEKKKTALIQKIEQTIKIPFKIIDHKVGIRPTVIDRRPMIGKHPKHKKMFIFNGLGTKGLSLAPYFVNHFIDCLAMNKVLHPEVDIKRFESKYYEQT